MMMVTSHSIVLFVCLVIHVSSEEKDLSNGWGDSIKWTTIADAKESDKPTMLIIHKSWCGACKALKPKFAESKVIAELSQHFAMVNLIDDDEPDEEMYAPDGKYIPRILFIWNGEVKEDVYNRKGNPKYKYYYHSASGVEESMADAMERLKLKPSDRVEL